MKEFLNPALTASEDEPRSWAEVNAEHAIQEKKRLSLLAKEKIANQGDLPTSWKEAKENAKRKYKKAA